MLTFSLSGCDVITYSLATFRPQESPSRWSPSSRFLVMPSTRVSPTASLTNEDDDAFENAHQELPDAAASSAAAGEPPLGASNDEEGQQQQQEEEQTITSSSLDTIINNICLWKFLAPQLFRRSHGLFF